MKDINLIKSNLSNIKNDIDRELLVFQKGGREKPIGAISPSGKYVKTSKGWVPKPNQKKSNQQQPKRDIGKNPMTFDEVLNSEHRGLVEALEHGFTDKAMEEKTIDELKEKTGYDYRRLSREHRNPVESFIGKFSDEPKGWGEATDELRDLARTARIYLEEYENKKMKPLNFKEIKTPKEWNQKSKHYIRSLYASMNPETKKKYNEYIKDFHEEK